MRISDWSSDVCSSDLRAGAPYHGVRADAYELMHGGQAAQYGPVADMDMSRQLHAVGDDGMATYLAIVRDMHIGHDPVVVFQAGHAHVLRGTGVAGDVFAHHIAITAFKTRGFALIFFYFRPAAVGAENRKNGG